MEPVLDDVANRDDADDAAAIDHGHMTELARGHALHDARDGFGRMAGLDLARHRPAHRLVERARSALRQDAHDVAFRDDAGDTAISAEDESRADALAGEQPHGVGETGGGFDADYLAALARENGADGHRSLPRFTANGGPPSRSGSTDVKVTFWVGAEFHRRAIFDRSVLVCPRRAAAQHRASLGVARKTGADSACSVVDEGGSGVVPLARSERGSAARLGLDFFVRRGWIESIEQHEARQETADMRLPG